MSWNPNANSFDPRRQQYQQPQYQQPNPYAQPQGYQQPAPHQHGYHPGHPGMMQPRGGAPMYGGGGVPQQQYYGQQMPPQHHGYGPPQRMPEPHRGYDRGYQPPRGGGGGFVVDPNAYGGRDVYQTRYDHHDGYRGGGGGLTHPQYQPSDGYEDNWDDDVPIHAVAAARIDKEAEFARQQQEAAAEEAAAAAAAAPPTKKRKRKRGKKNKKTGDTDETPSQPEKPKPAPVVRLVNTSASTSKVSNSNSPSKSSDPPVVVSQPRTKTPPAPEPEPTPQAEPQPAPVEEEKKAPSATTTQGTKKSKKKKNKTKVTWNRHDPREHINLVLIGHVDAGKSTLSGQILLQLDKIDERTIAKYEREAKERNRESWWIAYIMDEDDEERAKGKTVECGRAHFDTPSKRYTILDAPGHKNYVPNMISGAAQADVAVLVISARSGEFEAGFERGGQTQEHAQLAFTLGITRLVIVVNKMDTCDYSQDRFNTIIDRTSAFLKECGYKEKNMNFLPIAGQTGGNVCTPFDEGLCPWWDGLNLIQTLDSLKKIKRLTSLPLRITILDRYKGDKGLTAIGKVEAGVVSVGTPICVMPSGASGVVGSLCIDEEPVESAGAGENVLVTFTSSGNINDSRLFGGSVISAPDPDAVPVATRFKTEIYLIDLPEAGIMAVGFRAMFHCHNVAAECEISAIPHRINRKLGKVSRRPPPFLKLKDSAVAELTILSGGGCAVEPFDDCAPLGRFTLRDQGKTVVIGIIKEVLE